MEFLIVVTWLVLSIAAAVYACLGTRFACGASACRQSSTATNVRLLLDTGAGGIMVGRKVAEKAGLTRITSGHYSGIGDKGIQTGYSAVADSIRVGELEFQDCVVSVSDKRSLADEDGLIGADVFGAYLIDIDLPGMRLKLSPLPKRPEDAVALTVQWRQSKA